MEILSVAFLMLMSFFLGYYVHESGEIKRDGERIERAVKKINPAKNLYFDDFYP